MQVRSAWMFGVIGLLGLLVPGSAHANGQSTHLWITDDALTHVPDGPLAEFLAREELRKMLRNGTMFPDGGYPIDDPYAEIAHWEPFQTTYLDWIRANYEIPLSVEGSEHLAFLLGMASHGMADQVFDSMYGERVTAYDGAFGDFDTASDLIMMSNFPPMMAPSDWVPYTVFDSLYDAVGYDVDPARMMQGQNLLRIAVNSVAVLSQMPDVVAEQSAPFPWGSQHLLDLAVPGSPPCEGEVVARYWRVLWALAHGQPLPGPVLATMPADGAANHPIDSSSIESWVTVVFSRGLEDAPLSADSFHVEAEGGNGESIPVVLWHYYGQDAHVVHLRPQQDFAPDTIYTVTVDPGVQTIHGDALDGYQFRFSTGGEGPDPIVPEWPPDYDPDPAPGDGDGDPGDGDPGDGDLGDGDGDPSGESTGESGESGPAASEDPAGCSCATSSPSGSLLWLVGLLGLGAITRRSAAGRRAPSARI